MLNKLLTHFRQEFQDPIFVLGTGRSGTHWIAYTLKAHPNIEVMIEKPPIFGWVTTMALNPETQHSLFPTLVKHYRREIVQAKPCRFLDKSHPNIWLAEDLRNVFPQAQFIGIERDPFATVASMIMHEGVSAWHHRWREFPVPNRFLGITHELAETYEELPFAAKCAIRWVSHHRQMEHLRKTLGSSLLVFNYEELAQDTDGVLARLQSFLQLNQPIPRPEIKKESLSKWRSQFSEDQINQIRDIVGFGPDVWPSLRDQKRVEQTN